MAFLRKVSVLSVSAALALSLTGCSFSREVASLDMYTPSDGTQTDITDVKARNFMFFELESNRTALVGSFVNSGQVDETVKIQIMGEGGREDTVFEVPAGGKVDIGYNGTEAKYVSIGDQMPGSMFPIYIQVGTQTPVQMDVPVMDGSLPEYLPLIATLNQD